MLCTDNLCLALPLVDLNSATVQQLRTVKGIGPAKARAIIAWRKRRGPFKAVDDLKQVPGFGEKLTLRLKPYLIVQNPACPVGSAWCATGPRD